MSGWFERSFVETGRVPLLFFFLAFVLAFGFIRLSVRLIRAQVRWWPGNVESGAFHVHHMVFGVVFMLIAGLAAIASARASVGWHAGFAALFGVGAALVLDEFALMLHLRDVYWSSAGRVSIDAVFLAVGVTMLLLIGISPAVIPSSTSHGRHVSTIEAVSTFAVSLAVVLALASITLLKGKIWTGLFGLFVPLLLIVGAIRLARPESPWARWRYQQRPRKLARASKREERVRRPAIRAKVRVEDLVSGLREHSDAGPPGLPT